MTRRNTRQTQSDNELRYLGLGLALIVVAFEIFVLTNG
jgi:hypothetical protein